MPEKAEISTVQVPANATKDQLLAALAEANATIESAAATGAELVSANHKLHTEVHALKDANDKLQAQVSDLAAAGKKAESKHAGRGTHVRVSSAHKAGQHYRAGRLWTRDATDVHKDELTSDQLAAMQADPMLVVVDL